MFQKKLKNDVSHLNALLEEVQKTKGNDFEHLFQVYYQLGNAYLEKQDFERAMLYLQRADSLSLSIENLDISDELMDACSQTILELQDCHLLCEQTIQKIDEASQSLNYVQMTLWNLMTLCRMEPLFQLFEDQKGCTILQRVPQMTNLVFKILTEDISQVELNIVSTFIDDLYDFTDSSTIYDPHLIRSISDHKEPLQIVDFHGSDALTSLYIFLDHELNILMDKETSDEFATDFVIAGLGILKSYYLRTQPYSLKDIPQIQNELHRIWQDYEMIFNEPELNDVIQTMAYYRQLNIFQ